MWKGYAEYQDKTVITVRREGSCDGNQQRELFEHLLNAHPDCVFCSVNYEIVWSKLYEEVDKK